ncbi:hypothetical protein C8J57DRAFT_1516532 [Mycena rebaudengoi]|nr:hypothetical protein C8J57DRAFT_1516532 [Mycena rebaudengoi]
MHLAVPWNIWAFLLASLYDGAFYTHPPALPLCRWARPTCRRRRTAQTSPTWTAPDEG